MIYIICGTDSLKARRAWQNLLGSLKKKHDGMTVFALDKEKTRIANLEELLAGQTLFDKKYIVACDHLLGESELARYIVDHAEEFSQAQHLFVFLEDALAKDLRALEKAAFKTQTFNLSENKEKGFNLFSVADALGTRDRKSLWIKYQQALRSKEFDAEEIFWKLAWQIKTMLLVKTAGKEKIDLHPYVLGKMKAATDKYSIDELRHLSAGLVDLYHQARRGKVDLDLALETWVLSV